MSGQRFVLAPEAREDLLQIWNYIAEDSLEGADQVLVSLYDAFGRLARAPAMGHHRPDLADSRHRFWSVYSYVIAYRWQTHPIEILTVVHGARHLEAFLQSRISDRQETDKEG